MTEIRGGVEVRLDKSGQVEEVTGVEPLSRCVFRLERTDDGRAWLHVGIGDACLAVHLIALPDGELQMTHEWQE